jgi:hypothetical protein
MEKEWKKKRKAGGRIPFGEKWHLFFSWYVFCTGEEIEKNRTVKERREVAKSYMLFARAGEAKSQDGGTSCQSPPSSKFPDMPDNGRIV